ncbi:FtsH protease activity modulator HflK [Candidatus Binatia bacterium]|nr:FtsH protease activity modulator HflK [Candidatus Binatia bacterium]
MPERFPDWDRRSGAQDPFNELYDLWQRLRARWGQSSGPSRIGPWPILLLLLLLWAASGVFIVAPDERGIVLRFGQFVREVEPGPNYHLPWPIEQVVKPSVTQIRKDEFGFRTVSAGPPTRYQDVDVEALMLTGDENIVKLQFIVQYRIKPEPGGPRAFLFNLRNGQKSLRDAAEAAMREVIGRTQIDDALTEGRQQVEENAQVVLQQILDRYDSGIEVVAVKLQDVDPPDQVSDAFKDVISAQQDRERMINEALGYANDVVPKARGQAAQLLNEAEGYREAKVRDATGQAERFVALQKAYAEAAGVTRKRLYLETMETILPQTNIVLVDEEVGQRVVPYLPLGATTLRAPGSGSTDTGLTGR